jgi:hypothetical protein
VSDIIIGVSGVSNVIIGVFQLRVARELRGANLTDVVTRCLATASTRAPAGLQQGEELFTKPATNQFHSLQFN